MHFSLFCFHFHVYSEHDDRDRPGPVNISIQKKNGSRSVSFKKSATHHGPKQNIKLRTASLGLQAHFGDGDEQMANFKVGSFRRRSAPVPGGGRKMGKTWLNDNASEWFQVTVNCYQLLLF